jgi:putative oxidoreductase
VKFFRFLSSKWFTIVLRLVLGGVFIAAGGLKIFDPAGFAVSVANYRLVPHDLINLVAITLPWIEVLAGLFLVFGFWTRASAVLISGMTAVFMVAIVTALARGLDIECGCFGTVGGRQSGLVTLGQDVVLLACGLWLIRKHPAKPPEQLEAGIGFTTPSQRQAH